MVQEISLGLKKLDAWSGKPKTIDSKAMLPAMEANLTSNTQ